MIQTYDLKSMDVKSLQNRDKKIFKLQLNERNMHR